MSRASYDLFMQWFRNNHPTVYAATMSALTPSGGGMARVRLAGLSAGDAVDTYGAGEWGNGDSPYPVTTTTDTTSSIFDKILGVADRLLQNDAQRKLLDLNIERAKRNMPPLTAEQLAAGANPGVVVYSPMQKGMIALGIGAAAFYFLQNRRPARRR